jgi:GntR family transcriptional repressor for pyruvate dehydrogenase complex
MSELSFSSVVVTGLVDRVTEELTSAIVGGRLSPGAVLPAEARLAAEFGVSKQVVREALRHLAAIGVVEGGQGRSTRVRQLGPEPLRQFWRLAAGDRREGLAEAVELRRMLEPQVARLAAARRTAGELAALRLTLQAMHAAIADAEAWITADLDFHDQVARMSHNRLVVLQVLGLRPVIEHVMNRFGRNGRSGADMGPAWQRHARVVDAIGAGDPEAAAAAMLAHFAAADGAISELYPQEVPPDGEGGDDANSHATRGAGGRGR